MICRTITHSSTADIAYFSSTNREHFNGVRLVEHASKKDSRSPYTRMLYARQAISVFVQICHFAIESCIFLSHVLSPAEIV